MPARWGKNKSWRAHQAQQLEEALANERRIADEAAERQLFDDSVGDSPAAGHYQNRLGSHFEVTNIQGQVRTRHVPDAARQAGPGREWLPLFPQGNEGDLFTWRSMPLFGAKYVKVILFDVGFDEVRYVWGKKYQEAVWVVQNRPAQLQAGEGGMLLYHPMGPSNFEHGDRPCYINLGEMWEPMTEEVQQDLQLVHFTPQEPEQPLLEAPQPLVGGNEVQMPVEVFQVEAPQPPVLDDGVQIPVDFFSDAALASMF
ncbi:hypothetical protein N0V83_010407 [Neocucurbitaria cava]|uniref:Uncharacterized protein n=1 Tax=Neocucurbitaria cava TaxID=798079 RepID=A0A9W8XXJ2_9PLEO|nr:hypothetical protein N0V83_010407 [Neocucurbitaria cava]